MSVPLLSTKFYIPPSGSDRLSRARLLERLDEGLLPGRPLILVCAPAGYGKTTLLSEWGTAARRPAAQFAWLSLEAADNDPARFFSYLAAALKKVVPGAPALVEDLLAAPQLPPLPDLAAALVNPLASCSAPLAIVLDDYQAIHERGLHAAVEFLVEHLPAHVHLVLATRSDPPLPLHRLRARGQLVELRLDDLRFDRTETGQLLTNVLPSPLSDEEIVLLEERTEGWAAGLRMALLSMRGKADLTGFLQNLSGSQRYILDYLTEEALHNQPAEVQSFLFQTAVLDRLCAPLCNALTGQEDGQELLEGLERANCFIIPLDEERTWFRYHHLFADLLRARLKQRAQRQPGLIESLHSRAAAWLEEAGCSEEAVQHSLQAGDYDRAARIVEHSSFELFARGRLHQLLSWFHLLPEDLAVQRPWLNVYRAWALAFAGQISAAEQHLALAEASPAAPELTSPEGMRLRAEIGAIRSLNAVSGGSLAAALALTELPDDTRLSAPEAQFARSVQRWAVGYALRMQGNLPEARRCFEEVLEIGYRLDNLWTIVTASVDLGAVLRRQGELERAEAVYRTGLGRAHQAAGSPGYVGRLEAFLAFLLLERGEFAEAQALVDAAIAHNRHWENPNHCAYAWMVQSRLALAQHQPADAAAALAEAETWRSRGPVVPPLQASLEMARVMLWLQTGAAKEASAWLAQQKFAAPLSEVGETLRTAAVRVLLANGSLAEARALLVPLEAAARQSPGGRLSLLIETLALRACAAAAPAEAAAALKEALVLGLPRGFRQVFLDAGSRLVPALESCQDMPGTSGLLLELRASEKAPSAAAPGPLTGREVEILRWMASGLSNPQIGARLFISAGTVKAHTAAIYRKLDAANRAEAIAKAKDLGLL